MKIVSVNQCDKFDENEYCCWVEVTDVPETIIQEAKEIDGIYYDATCFGVCVTCSDGKWLVCQDAPECELYYIDFFGNTIWLNCVLSDAERENAIEYCKDYIEAEKEK